MLAVAVAGSIGRRGLRAFVGRWRPTHIGRIALQIACISYCIGYWMCLKGVFADIQEAERFSSSQWRHCPLALYDAQYFKRLQNLVQWYSVDSSYPVASFTQRSWSCFMCPWVPSRRFYFRIRGSMMDIQESKATLSCEPWYLLRYMLRKRWRHSCIHHSGRMNFGFHARIFFASSDAKRFWWLNWLKFIARGTFSSKNIIKRPEVNNWLAHRKSGDQCVTCSNREESSTP
jgi:hypothetical protein